MKKIIFSLFIVSILLSACKKTKTSSKPTISVTIEPLRFFTEQVAGDRFKVVTLVPNGGNPETYEPTARQMMDLSHSTLYVKVGEIGFERTWMERLKESAPHLKLVDSSRGINLVESSHGTEDPHTWMSTSNAVIILQNIYKAIVEEMPKDSAYFKQNLNNALTKINNTNNTIKQAINKTKAQAFLIYHPTLTYFARDYSLAQITVEEEGREPSALQLKDIIVSAKKKNVKVMFVQKEFTNRNTEIVAKGCNTKEIDINPLSYNWHKEMIKIAENLE